MKINKKSWHYRLINISKEHEWDIKNNLCGYFRQVVGAIIFFTFLSTIVLFWSGNAIYAVFVTPTDGFLLGIAMVWWVLVGIIFGSVSGAIDNNHWLQLPIRLPKRVPRVKTHKEPGIVRQWMKAKHDKVCPVLEFTDEG